MNDTFDYLEARVWPYDSSYLCVCSNCGNRYAGPKRSPCCWLCTGDEVKLWWHERNKGSE